MPATAAKTDPKTDLPPTPPPAKTPDAVPVPDMPEQVKVPAGRLAPGGYEFTGAIATCYLEVPLTARPESVDGPATVFDWPFGAPDDGRWQPTKHQPTQAADNAAPLTSEE